MLVGTNVQTTFGVDAKMFYSIIIVISILLSLQRKTQILRDKSLVFLIILVSTYSVFKIYTDQGEGTRNILLQIIGTPFIFAAYPLLTDQHGQKNLILWRRLTFIFFFSFLLETILAIVERILSYNFFEWKIEGALVNFSTDSDYEFRSSALYGHPLSNALLVTTCMTFILRSSLKPRYKYLLWGLGFVAILSFNTRSSIVCNVLLLLINFTYTVLVEKKINLKDRLQQLLAIISILIVGLFFFFKLNFGGRLIVYGLFDDSSAQTRIYSWDIFNCINLNDILWGIPHNEMQLLMYRAGLSVTENFWIDQIFRLGIVFYFLYVCTYIVLIKKLYKRYSVFSALFTTSAFILIASTNNSLSSDFLALLVYLLLIVIFNPKYFNQLIPRKYLMVTQRSCNHQTHAKIGRHWCDRDHPRESIHTIFPWFERFYS